MTKISRAKETAFRNEMAAEHCTALRGSGYDSLILGNGNKGIYSMDPRESLVNNNVMVISGTGGGKTKSVVEANLLHAEHQSMVVLLTKRRLLDQYGPLLQRRGYNVKVMDLVHPDDSDLGYDPLSHVRDDADLTMLSANLFACTGDTDKKDVYWTNSAASLFRAFAKLAIHKSGPHARMKDVLYLLRFIDVEQKSRIDEEKGVEYVSPCCPREDFANLAVKDQRMYNDWRQYKDNADNTKDCIRSVLLTALNTLFTDGLLKLMKKQPQLVFTDLVKQRTVLFIITSPVNPALHPFANLVLGTMFKELFEYAEEQESGRLPIPLMTICDDFAVGGQIPNFQQHISIFREKGISVMMLVQSLSQLAGMYGENAAITIRDNTDSTVYLGGNDLATARDIGRRLNKPEDEVLALRVGKEYLLRRGQAGLELDRYRILDDPLYRQEIAPQEIPHEVAPNGKEPLR